MARRAEGPAQRAPVTACTGQWGPGAGCRAPTSRRAGAGAGPSGVRGAGVAAAAARLTANWTLLSCRRRTAPAARTCSSLSASGAGGCPAPASPSSELARPRPSKHMSAELLPPPDSCICPCGCSTQAPLPPALPRRGRSCQARVPCPLSRCQRRSAKGHRCGGWNSTALFLQRSSPWPGLMRLLPPHPRRCSPSARPQRWGRAPSPVRGKHAGPAWDTGSLAFLLPASPASGGGPGLSCSRTGERRKCQASPAGTCARSGAGWGRGSSRGRGLPLQGCSPAGASGSRSLYTRASAWCSASARAGSSR